MAETTVKERPILFSGEMVKAILDGRKTQTRRVVKPQFNHLWGRGAPMKQGFEMLSPEQKWKDAYAVHVDIPTPDGWLWIFCPHGKPGDRLWVRETWAKWTEGEYPECCVFRADGDKRAENFGPWKPSIFMPRWASRITLEITDIRVERLQEISEADKLAEGGTAEVPFGTVWKRINTKPGIRWEDNPYVWAISFKRVTP